jgi:hypothetical protein
MPPRKRAPRKTKKVEEELVIKVEEELVIKVEEAPVVDPPHEIEIEEVCPPPPPPVEEPSSPASEQIKDMLIMRQMQYTMLEQAQMIQSLRQRLDEVEEGGSKSGKGVEVEEEEEEEERNKKEEVDMGWPEEKKEEEQEVEEDDPMAYRREKKDRKFEDVYATDGSYDNDKNITLTDAGSGTWGSMSQTPSHVGLRTRSLFLTPTLQQPSIGGLI